MKTYWSSALVSLMVCGCALGPSYEQAAESQLIAFNYAAADHLLTQALPALDPSKPVVATTLVSIDDPNQSSRLGRLISEHMASRLTQSGMPVVEAANRGSFLVHKAEGPPMLSREVQEITPAPGGQAIMVGTYARARDYVYVTVKLVRSGDNLVVAAYNYVLPLDTNIEAMLAPR